MRTIHEVVIECKADFQKENKLLKAAVANGWLALRPDFSDPEKPRFVKALDQDWAQQIEGLKFGTHRLKQSWIDQRFQNLDDDGMPLEIKVACDKNGIPDDAEYEQNAPEGQTKSVLSVWKELATSGELTEAQLAELKEHPGIELRLDNFSPAHLPSYKGRRPR